MCVCVRFFFHRDHLKATHGNALRPLSMCPKAENGGFTMNGCCKSAFMEKDRLFLTEVDLHTHTHTYIIFFYREINAI